MSKRVILSFSTVLTLSCCIPPLLSWTCNWDCRWAVQELYKTPLRILDDLCSSQPHALDDMDGCRHHSHFHNLGLSKIGWVRSLLHDDFYPTLRWCTNEFIAALVPRGQPETWVASIFSWSENGPCRGLIPATTPSSAGCPGPPLTPWTVNWK